MYLVFNEASPDNAICFRIDRADPVGLSPHATSAVSKRTKTSAKGENLKFGRFRLLKNLGSGSFAQVKLAFDVESNTLVALKFIDKFV